MFRFQWEEAQDCYVLLYPEGMVKLSHSAGEILKHCDGKKSIQDIIVHLKEQYPNADLDEDVVRFIEEAMQHGWLRI
ncbi:MAG: pyrroloquinoline quinone biosynthesis peptide chaperone PqqD [Gammaproteobacteria bacterium]